MNVRLDDSVNPPVFRFEDNEGERSRVLQIRVTEVGAAEPSWLLVPIGSQLEVGEMVEAHILTPEEAERAGALGTFDFQGELNGVVAAFGVPVSAVTYGRVPDGFKQEGPLRPLEPHRLYQLLVMGTSLAELEFYG